MKLLHYIKWFLIVINLKQVNKLQILNVLWYGDELANPWPLIIFLYTYHIIPNRYTVFRAYPEYLLIFACSQLHFLLWNIKLSRILAIFYIYWFICTFMTFFILVFLKDYTILPMFLLLVSIIFACTFWPENNPHAPITYRDTLWIMVMCTASAENHEWTNIHPKQNFRCTGQI